MFKTPLPFFLKKSNFENASPLNYLNSFCINNKYVEFEKLKNSKFNEIAKNNAPFCSECGALLNITYKFYNSIWRCPFCGIDDKIEPERENFLLDCYFSSQRTPSIWEDKILIVLCLDYSNSMNSSYFPLEKKEKILNSLKDKEILEVKMVSRKKIMISALEGFLTSLLDKSSRFDIRVFVIVFNNEVKLFGNSRKNDVVLTGEKLMDLDFCFNEGKKSARDLCSSKFDKMAKDRILNTLNKLCPYGETALGPAIAAGLGVLEAFAESDREKDRFKNCYFNVFTDGKSNVGLGPLDFSKNEKEIMESSFKCYERMNELALKHYPIFNFITFEDEVSRTKVFKSKLMKKLNGKLFQIKVQVKNKNQSEYKFYDELKLNKFFYDMYENIFEGKLMKLSIYQMPTAGLVLCEKNKRDIQKIHKNCKFLKNSYYVEGEPMLGVYFDYEKALENEENINFQIQIEFFNLYSKKSEVFVSSFQQKFWKESEANNYKNICDKETLQLILKLQFKKEKIENICLEILSNIQLYLKENISLFNSLIEAIKLIITEEKKKNPLKIEGKKAEEEKIIVEDEKKLEKDKKIEIEKKPQEEKKIVGKKNLEIKNDKKIDQNIPQNDDSKNIYDELENDRKTTENFFSKKKQLNSLSFNTMEWSSKDQSQNFHKEHKFNENESEQFDVQGNSFKDQSKAFNHKEHKWAENESFREQINCRAINELKNESVNIMKNDNIEEKSTTKEDENDGGSQLKEEQKKLDADVEEKDQSRGFSHKEDKHNKLKNDEELEGRSKEESHNSQYREDKDQSRRFLAKECKHHEYEKDALEEESQEESPNSHNMEDKDQKYENEEEERKSNALEYKEENQNNQIIEEKDQSIRFFHKEKKHDKIEEEERNSNDLEGKSREESENFQKKQNIINVSTDKDQGRKNKIQKSESKEEEQENLQLLKRNHEYESDNFQNKQLQKKTNSKDSHSSIAFNNQSESLMQKVHIYDAEDQSRNFENKDQSRNFSHKEHKFDIDEDIENQSDNGTSGGFKDQSQSVFRMKENKIKGNYGDDQK